MILCIIIVKYFLQNNYSESRGVEKKLKIKIDLTTTDGDGDQRRWWLLGVATVMLQRKIM